MRRGLFIGRFQPFHLGHLQDIKNALKDVDELVIGIGSSNEKHTKYNPFSVKERIEMIDLVLPANEISKYTIFPIPDLHDDKKWVEPVVWYHHSLETYITALVDNGFYIEGIKEPTPIELTPLDHEVRKLFKDPRIILIAAEKINNTGVQYEM